MWGPPLSREESPPKARFNLSAKRLNHFGSSLLKAVDRRQSRSNQRARVFLLPLGRTIISSGLAILFLRAAGPWRVATDQASERTVRNGWQWTEASYNSLAG